MSQQSVRMPGCLRPSGAMISRTTRPEACEILSASSSTSSARKYWITASVGGFSPTKYWWPQNSSLRSSSDFHCSASGIVKSQASSRSAAAARYSWIGSR